MGWLDRVIAVISPAWAYRRSRFRDALRAEAEPAEPRRRDDSGWMRIDDPNNPLNTGRLRTGTGVRAEWPSRDRMW